MDAREVTAKQALQTFLRILIHAESTQELLQNLTTLRLLGKDFETKFILNNTVISFTLTKEVEENPDYWLFYLEAQDKWPHRVEMIKKHHNWQLKSFLFACTGCFGDYDDCGVCGGSGWGVL